MKSLTTNCMIAVAALAAAAGSASAQVLKAEIPFTFRAGKALMPPGSYELNLGAAPSRTFFILRNAQTKASVMLADRLARRALIRAGLLTKAKKVWRDRLRGKAPPSLSV